MFAEATDPFEAWVNPATEAFEFWVSLWPTAPLFGVEWRFADAVAEANPFTKVEVATVVRSTEIEAAIAPAVVVTPVAEIEPADETKTQIVTGKPASLMAKAPANPDDLKLIKGIGPGLEQQLNALGVYKFAQIGGFSDAELTWVDDNLTSLKGRCFRDNWVAQAKTLLG